MMSKSYQLPYRIEERTKQPDNCKCHRYYFVIIGPGDTVIENPLWTRELEVIEACYQLNTAYNHGLQHGKASSS